MKNHERRAAGRVEFWKVARWDYARFCWRDGDKQFESEAEAVASVPAGEKYRLSRCNAETGTREDLRGSIK